MVWQVVAYLGEIGVDSLVFVLFYFEGVFIDHVCREILALGGEVREGDVRETDIQITA